MKDNIQAIEYPFAIDAGFGRLATEDDFAEHVEQLIKQVLLTNPGERVNRPDFGCGVRRMLFAPNSQESASLAQVTIFQALEKWLGSLISVNKVEVSAENELLSIRVAYLLKVSKERRYINMEINV